MLERFFQSARLRVILIKAGLLAATLVSASCAASDDATITQNLNDRHSQDMNSKSNTAPNSPTPADVSRDIEALGKTIGLPVRPRAAVWNAQKLGNANNQVPGPTDYRLVAVFEFDEAGVKTLLEKIGETSPAAAVRIENWFPEELKKAAETSKSNAANDPELEGKKYDADLFLRSPYTNGTLTRIDQTNYFVLRLLSF